MTKQLPLCPVNVVSEWGLVGQCSDAFVADGLCVGVVYEGFV